MNAQAVHACDCSDRHVVHLGRLRVLICEEDGEWFAQGVELDYAASGGSLDEVQRRFQKGLAATVHLHLSRFQSIERLLKYPPKDVWQRLKPSAAYALDMLTVHDMAEDTGELRELPFDQIVYLRERAARHADTAQG